MNVPAVTGVAFVSAPTVSFVTTLPVTVFGIASSVMLLMSPVATGLLSVMRISKLSLLVAPKASVTATVTLSVTSLLALWTLGS